MKQKAVPPIPTSSEQDETNVTGKRIIIEHILIIKPRNDPSHNVLEDKVMQQEDDILCIHNKSPANAKQESLWEYEVNDTISTQQNENHDIMAPDQQIYNQSLLEDNQYNESADNERNEIADDPYQTDSDASYVPDSFDENEDEVIMMNV